MAGNSVSQSRSDTVGLRSRIGDTIKLDKLPTGYEQLVKSTCVAIISELDKISSLQVSILGKMQAFGRSFPENENISAMDESNTNIMFRIRIFLCNYTFGVEAMVVLDSVEGKFTLLNKLKVTISNNEKIFVCNYTYKK